MDHQDAGQGMAGWRDYLLFYVTVAGGLGTFALMGLAAHANLRDRGIAVIPLERGAHLLLPLALIFEIPVLVVAVMNLRTLNVIGAGKIGRFMRLHLALTALTTETDDIARIRAGQTGAALGTIVAMGATLWAGLTYVGPGGFAEVVAMSLTMAPLLFGGLLLQAAIGAFIGGLLGVLVLTWLRRRHAD